MAVPRLLDPQERLDYKAVLLHLKYVDDYSVHPMCAEKMLAAIADSRQVKRSTEWIEELVEKM